MSVKNLFEKNKQITSNDVVAKLVDNGLSYDYASKVKNKSSNALKNISLPESKDQPFGMMEKAPIRKYGEPFVVPKNKKKKKPIDELLEIETKKS